MVWIVESGSCRVMFSQYLGDSLPQTHQLFLINIISYRKHHPYWPPSFLRCTPDRTAAFLRDYGKGIAVSRPRPSGDTPAKLSGSHPEGSR